MAEISLLFALLVTILWIIIGWRAMKAHEKIALQCTRYLDLREQELKEEETVQDFRKETAEHNKEYRRFRKEHPEVTKMLSRDRHLLFREWLDEQKSE